LARKAPQNKINSSLTDKNSQTGELITLIINLRWYWK